LLPSSADGLIVRKPPEFVKKKCLEFVKFQGLIIVAWRSKSVEPAWALSGGWESGAAPLQRRQGCGTRCFKKL